VLALTGTTSAQFGQVGNTYTYLTINGVISGSAGYGIAKIGGYQMTLGGSNTCPFSRNLGR
jgi:hypothetical protein